MSNPDLLKLSLLLWNLFWLAELLMRSIPCYWFKEKRIGPAFRGPDLKNKNWRLGNQWTKRSIIYLLVTSWAILKASWAAERAISACKNSSTDLSVSSWVEDKSDSAEPSRLQISASLCSAAQLPSLERKRSVCGFSAHKSGYTGGVQQNNRLIRQRNSWVRLKLSLV